MNIDDMIKGSLNNSAQEIDISYEELNSIWASIEMDIEKDSKPNVIERLKPLFRSFNFADSIEVAVFALILFFVPFAVNNFKYIPKTNLEAQSSKNINKHQTDSENIIIDKNSTAGTPLESAPEIVLYNTHNSEAYTSGKKITAVSEELNSKLINLGFKSTFLDNDNDAVYTSAYKNSKKLIEDKVKNYDEKVLLDIHTDTSKKVSNKIQIVLSKKNPNYEENKRFADLLIKEINKSPNIKGEIYYYTYGIDYFNQQLSVKALLVDIGSDFSSNEDIKDCMNVLSKSLYEIFSQKKLQ